MLRKLILYGDVIRRLGVLNSAYVAWYRFTLKTQIRKRLFPYRSFVVCESFFKVGGSRSEYSGISEAVLLEEADKIVSGQIRYYACQWKHLGNPPNWFLNPFNGKVFPNHLRHWTEIKDFDSDAGDIKTVWEASRFEWAVTLARAFALSGQDVYLDTLNGWLNDWVEKNPLNIGPNWKCGQEASIRVFNLMQTAMILGQTNNSSRTLRDIIYRHLERIDANIRYAIVQDNNHGTSEAAALFIGGNWYAMEEVIDAERKKKCFQFARKGRQWLENRVEKLIAPDGSFAQHSTTYHRVLLDTLIFIEYWRRTLKLDPLSSLFYQRAKAATYWLYMMTDDISGRAPNLGANDGAMFLNLHTCDYRDFRPSIQTASVLFNNRPCYKPGAWDEPAVWLGLKTRASCEENDNKAPMVFPGGYVVMCGKESWGLLRFPMYRFRPGHNDIFHFDLWYGGENILRDGGSYSYATSDGLHFYFTGAGSHNTIQFDNHDQMPRLSRFLFGNWIKASAVSDLDETDGTQTWSGSYTDGDGCFHERTVSCKGNIWEIDDEINGYNNSAVMRWRLKPADWSIENNCCACGDIEIVVNSSIAIKRFEIVEGFESLYYYEMSRIPVLEIEVESPHAVLKTRICLRRDQQLQ